MRTIQVLDPVTIDKIAAGEVIERPASVVKELVENAIDAGATSVTVEIQDGGITFLRIADNGCGIPRDQVAAAFLRHSTSKIRNVDDLAHIASLGFRGEALSSIAAVAQVEVLTKTTEDDLGCKYRINGGKEELLEEAVVPNGTTFLIRQLFYNIPARKKFLKTPMTEASHVGELMMRLSLSHPEISFLFINNGQSRIHTSGNGNLRDVIYHLYGREIAANLLEVHFEQSGIRVDGFLGAPIISRGNRNFETYFVNHRYIKSNLISKSIEDAYKDFSMQHKFPFVVLQVEMDGEGVDVNVHPAKMEVRFHQQQEVYDSIFTAVSQGLHEKELIPEVTVDIKPAVKQAVNKWTANKRATNKQAAKEQTAERQAAKEQTAERQAAKEQTAEKQAAKEQTAEKQAAKEQTAEKQTADAATDGETKERTTDSPEPPVKDLDYFMKAMRERVESYHAGSSSAEVKDKSGIFRPKMQAGRIREAVGYREKSVMQAEHSGAGEKSVAKAEHPEAAETSGETSGETSREKEQVAKHLEERQMNLFEDRLLDREQRAEYKLIGQLFETYWLVEFDEHLYIIDQHAAHERVLYERTLREMKNREYTSQIISPPIILNLTMQEAELFEKNKGQFERIGFEIEDFGQDSYAVRAVPDNLFSIAKKDLLMEMIDELSGEYQRSHTAELIDEKIASMSCKAAVKGNMKLSAAEVDALIGELLLLENPYHCPHGRPTIISMSKRELEKKFKRIVS